jgi:hypothetical protein
MGDPCGSAATPNPQDACIMRPIDSNAVALRRNCLDFYFE